MTGNRNAMDRLIDILTLGTTFLAERNVEDARLEAEQMLADSLGLDRVGLYLNFDRPLTETEKEKFRRRLRRRVSGEPLQYILGHTEFYGLKLLVRPGVLIPRSETEGVVDLAKRAVPSGGFASVLDLGCGSGAITLALLEQRIARNVLAVDISPDAVTVTVENAQALGYVETAGSLGGPDDITLEKHGGADNQDTQRCRVVKMDAFAPGFAPPGAPFDLVVSNPPYVREDEFDGLPVNVRDHEPRVALVRGKDGLDAHRAMAAHLGEWLREGGLFLGEIGASQGAEAVRIHETWASRVQIHRDYSGLDRIVEAHR